MGLVSVPPAVFLIEISNHSPGKKVPEIQDIMGDAKPVRDFSGTLDGISATAAPETTLICSVATRPDLHGNANNIVTVVFEQGGSQ